MPSRQIEMTSLTLHDSDNSKLKKNKKKKKKHEDKLNGTDLSEQSDGLLLEDLDEDEKSKKIMKIAKRKSKDSCEEVHYSVNNECSSENDDLMRKKKKKKKSKSESLSVNEETPFGKDSEDNSRISESNVAASIIQAKKSHKKSKKSKHTSHDCLNSIANATLNGTTTHQIDGEEDSSKILNMSIDTEDDMTKKSKKKKRCSDDEIDFIIDKGKIEDKRLLQKFNQVPFTYDIGDNILTSSNEIPDISSSTSEVVANKKKSKKSKKLKRAAYIDYLISYDVNNTTADPVNLSANIECSSENDDLMCKKKKKKKSKSESLSVNEETPFGKDSEDNSKISEFNIGVNILTSSNEIPDISSSTSEVVTNKKKSKKLKGENIASDNLFLNSNVEISNDKSKGDICENSSDVITTDSDVTVSSKKKGKKRKKDKSDINSSLSLNTSNGLSEIADQVSNIAEKLEISVNSEHIKSKKKKKRKGNDDNCDSLTDRDELVDENSLKRQNHESSECNHIDTISSANVSDSVNDAAPKAFSKSLNGEKTANQWQNVHFEQTDRANKFLRLMGGMKAKNSVNNVNSSTKFGGQVACDTTQQASLYSNLQQQYDSALNLRLSGSLGMGLGFAKPESAGKKFYIDKNSSSSIKFDS